MHVARIPSERYLAIDDRAGCTLRVVEGQVWITVDGHLRDIIANPGDVVALDRHARNFVSAFRDARVLIAAPAARDAAFATSDTHGLRLLTIATRRGLVATVAATASAAWSAAAAFVAFARRRVRDTLAAI